MTSIAIDRDDAVTALAIIETHPERHDQEQWRLDSGHPIEDFPNDPLNEACDTAFCLAGWVAVVNRVKWVARYDPVMGRYLLAGDAVAGPDCTCADADPYCTCGHFMKANEFARLRLGLGYEEADALFGPENAVEDLQEGVKALVNGAPVDGAVHDSHLRHNRFACPECFPEENYKIEDDDG